MSNEEHNIQVACVRWFAYQYPELRGLLFAVPNGGRRDAVTGAKMKAEGVVAGVSDLILLVPSNGHGALCVEMKTAKGRQTEKQKQWAFEHCFAPIAYYTKKSAWCTLCGGAFDWMASDLAVALEIDDKIICPHCGKELKLEKSRKIKDYQAWYYTVLTTKSGFQVCRNFIVEKTARKCGRTFMQINEAFQSWIRDDGRETIIARPCAQMMQCYDKWIFYRPMEIKEKTTNPYTPKHDEIIRLVNNNMDLIRKAI